MSFINEVSKMKDKMKTSNQGNPFTTLDQIDKLPRFLSICTYNDEIRPIIEKTVRQILNVFPSFKVEILQFYDNNFLFRFIELKRQITMPFQLPLQVYLMFPPTFPKNPPFFRVVNPNPQRMAPKPMFSQCQSRNDPNSLILNVILNETKNWNPSKSVVNIVIEINNLIRNNYPYQRKEQINQNFPLWGNNNNGIQPSPNKNMPTNYNNYAPNNAIAQNKWGIAPSNYKSLAQITSKAIFIHDKRKQSLAKMLTAYQQVLPKIQEIDKIRYSIQSEQEYLRNENFKMAQIIQNSTNSINLATIVRPKDSNSEKLLQYFSSVKARGNVATLLQQKFYEGEINLGAFLKFIKKNEESKFQEKYILIKLIKAQQEK